MSHPINHLYEFGPFCLNIQERLLLRAGEVVPLMPKTLDLLLVLVQERGRLLEKDDLLRRVWPDTFVEEANLSYNISLIRKALGEGENGHKFIETVPKRGYRFVAEVKATNGRKEEEPAAEWGAPATNARNEKPVVSGQDAAPGQPSRKFKQTIFVASMGLVLVGVVWGFYQLRHHLFSPARLSLPELKITPLTSFTGTEIQPTFSPDGGQVAFVWTGEQEDNFDIYVKQINGGGLLRLTSDPALDRSPAWSPDGRSIAFLRVFETHAALYLIPAIGGAERKLVEAPRGLGLGQRLSFSPDGKWLAFSDRKTETEPCSIFLFSLETGEKRQLTHPTLPVGDVLAAFSPDGQTVAFLRRSENVIYFVPAAGGTPRRFVADLSMVWDFVWSADGREILCADLRENGHKVYRLPLDSGKAEEVPVGERVGGLAIASRAERLAFVRGNDDLNIYRLELNGSPTPKPIKFIASTLNDHNPEYSADGTRIVFGSNRSGSNQIWSCDSNGSNATQLTFLKADCGSPRLSPDAQQIAFDASVEGQREILVVNATGGQPRRLTTASSEEIAPSWSRDGRWIYFGSNRSGSLQLWKVPATGGAAVQVTKQGGFEALESPDGKSLYFTKERSRAGIWHMPVEGGEEQLVLTHHRAGAWRHWVVVQEGIYFVTEVERFRPVIEFFHFDSGQVTTIATLDKPLSSGIRGIDVSPDRKWLLFTQADTWGSDILLMENFR